MEREVAYEIYNQDAFFLSLKESNFAVASNVQNAINLNTGGELAVALDSRTVRVARPSDANMIDFIAGILNIDVDYKALDKIIIDEKTGTIVSGINVAVDPVVITHGDITIKIEPNAYDEIDPQDRSVVDIRDGMAVDANSNRLLINGDKTTVASVARALNKLGASPSDIIAVMENLKRVGAIHVNLEVI